MTATATERRKQAGQEGESRNARLSQHKRAKRPIPVLRHEAEALFAPRARITPATVSRLNKLNELGLLRIELERGQPITQGEAHDAILDVLYGPCIPE